MKQVLQNLRTGKTTVEEVPVPSPQRGTVLVRTAASLVSTGTERMVVEFAEKNLLGKAQARPDLVRQVLDKARREGLLTTIEAAFNRLDQPMPLGYSSAGTIVALGEGLTGYQVGQRVACAGGGYAVHADYVTVPQQLLTPLPEAVDFESGAFATMGAIALHGFRLAEPQLGDRVAVIGLGLLGLLSVGIAAAAGCRVLAIDLDPDRIKLAADLGAVAVQRGEAEAAARSLTENRGCDAVLICAATDSNDPIDLAGAIARDRGTVVAVGAVGLEIPRTTYFNKELTFLVSRSYGPGRYDPQYEEKGQDYPIGYVRWTEGRNLGAFVELLETRRLDVRPLITHRFSIERAPEAYELILGKKKEAYLGVLITYPHQGDPPDLLEKSPRELASPDLPARQAGAPVSVGILGAGNFASAVLFPILARRQDLTLVGVASASGVNAQSAMKRFGFKYATSDEGQILADPAVGAVGILTRHHLHADQVQAAFEAGKHVFCEKPLAINEAQLTRITAALDENPLAPLLMVGFNRRFAPLAVQLKDFLADRREPLMARYRVNAGYLPLDHWLHDPEIGGGRIIGEGCHFIDFLTFLVGEAPVSVTAAALPDAGRYRQDNVLLTLNFPDGSIGSLSYLANGDKSFAKERVEVFTEGRVAVLDDFRTVELVADGRRRSTKSRFRQDKGHGAAWEAFLAALRTNNGPPIPYDQLVGVTRATFAAVEALQTGDLVKL